MLEVVKLMSFLYTRFRTAWKIVRNYVSRIVINKICAIPDFVQIA